MPSSPVVNGSSPSTRAPGNRLPLAEFPKGWLSPYGTFQLNARIVPDPVHTSNRRTGDTLEICIYFMCAGINKPVHEFRIQVNVLSVTVRNKTNLSWISSVIGLSAAADLRVYCGGIRAAVAGPAHQLRQPLPLRKPVFKRRQTGSRGGFGPIARWKE